MSASIRIVDLPTDDLAVIIERGLVEALTDERVAKGVAQVLAVHRGYDELTALFESLQNQQ